MVVEAAFLGQAKGGEEMDLARKKSLRALLSARDLSVQSTSDARCTTVLRRLLPPRSTEHGRPLVSRAGRPAESRLCLQNCRLAVGLQTSVVRALIAI
jgi:hypothetical protein